MNGNFPHFLPSPGYMIPHILTPSPQLLALGNAAPAKRASDEVQFVSSNPVKKRKLNGIGSSTSQPSMVVTVPPPASTVALPLAQQSLPGAVSILSSAPCPQPDAGITSTAAQKAPTEDESNSYPPRGTSEPVLSNLDFSNMWTAPPRGPKSSPALSPKSMPMHISPSALHIDRPSQTTAPAALTEHQARSQESSAQTEPVFPPSQQGEHGILSGQLLTKEAGAHLAPVSEPGFPSFLAQLDIQGMRMITHNSPTPVEECDPAESPSCGPGSFTAKVEPCRPPASDRTICGINNSTTTTAQMSTSTPEMVADSITVATHHRHETSLQQHSLHQPNYQTLPPHRVQNSTVSHTNQQQEIQAQCAGGAQHAAKGNCYRCLQAWLRRNGMPTGGTLSTSTTAKTQMMPYQGIYTQPWTHQLAMSGFPTPFHNAAAYGQLLRQHDQRPPPQHVSSATLPASVPSMAAATANMSNLPASTTNMLPPSIWTPQAAGLLHGAPPPPPPPAPRPPQTQPSGKHIIVDMAETCLDSFPFKEFAQRHNQPPKRIREIFEAIIQIPLLRCPTDKRRAGKVATVKMKEYAQAKKDLQAQMAGGQTQGGQGTAAAPQPPQPSAWEMAQYMGPSDVPIPGHLAFPGPW